MPLAALQRLHRVAVLILIAPLTQYFLDWHGRNSNVPLILGLPHRL